MSKINIAISNGQIQRHFYKYKPLNEYAEEMLTTGLVYFNKAEEFNDPYELQIEDNGSYNINDVINFFMNNRGVKMNLADATKLANDICKKYPNIGDFAKEQLEQTKQNHRKKIGIFCVANTPKNLLMWAHYADSHKGFALEIDISLLDDIFFPFKVEYEKKIPSMEYLKNNSDFLKKWVLTKSIHWKYEKERRMVIKDCSTQRKIQFPKQAFSKVFWVINVDITQRDKIMSQMRANGFNTQFYQEKFNPKGYQILFKKI
jgi:hypothetical protein